MIEGGRFLLVAEQFTDQELEWLRDEPPPMPNTAVGRQAAEYIAQLVRLELLRRREGRKPFLLMSQQLPSATVADLDELAATFDRLAKTPGLSENGKTAWRGAASICRNMRPREA